jgi:hypothetical protein
MVLSDVQAAALKAGETKLKFTEKNPKQLASKAWIRFEAYKMATTVQEALRKGASHQDLKHDFENGHVTIEGDGPTSQKRPPEAGTPDRDAASRAKVLVRGPGSQELAPTIPDFIKTEPVEKVEMSAATVAMLRRMMRETLDERLGATESKIEATAQQLRQELRDEKQARQQEIQELTARMERLEAKFSAGGGSAPTVRVTSHVDDERLAVVGGFPPAPKPRAVKLVSDALDEVPGVEEVFATQPLPKVVFARFRTAEQMQSFIRSQKSQAAFRDANLWASKNRSPSERIRGRALGKVKRMLIEVGGFSAADVIIDWRAGAVHVVRGDTAPKVAAVDEDGSLEWSGGLEFNIDGVKAAVERELGGN